MADYSPPSAPAAKALEAITLENLLIAAAAFVVAGGWGEFFNTFFESVADRLDVRENGPIELAMRLAYAVIVTLIVAFVLRKAINSYIQKNTDKRRAESLGEIAAAQAKLDEARKKFAETEAQRQVQ